ncbi:MAG: DNA-3-methyladenine glycosylase I [Clostridia bacterium]|nr:DNA-3-methyladenine glycosylase I [Clostridia bacterium]
MGRCAWGAVSPEMQRYHDEEWGFPLHDDRKLFEFLMLECLQCGLSWDLMIRKRAIFSACFDGFDYDKIAAYGPADEERILQTEGMLRSPRKVRAVIANARCFQTVCREYGSFEAWLWRFTDGKTVLYEGHETGDIPAANALSDAVAAELKRRGFTYLGPVTVYAYLQACGLVNDHQSQCDCYSRINRQFPTVRLPRTGERR